MQRGSFFQYYILLLINGGKIEKTSMYCQDESSFKWKVTVSGELMFLESTVTVTSKIQ